MSDTSPAAGPAWFGPKERAILLDPVLLNNPIGVQVLGICSALAVTTSVAKALVMSAGLTAGHGAGQPGGEPGAQTHSVVHPHHRAAGHHRHAGDRV
jgi:hypothetical protein